MNPSAFRSCLATALVAALAITAAPARAANPLFPQLYTADPARDQFVFGEDPLVEIPGSGYATEIESYARVRRMNPGASDEWWEVTRRDGRVVGSAALEVYEDGALLRSVAVDASRRGAGLGSELTAAAIRLAEALRAPALYLLTTTADGYFPKFGFESISRAEVPPAVQTSVEFVSACPASAIVMRKRL